MLRKSVNRRALFLVIAYILFCFIFNLIYPHFLNLANINGIVRQLAFIVITSLGFTMIIASGGFDMSVGAVASVGGVTTAILLSKGISLPIAMLTGIGVGALFGLINGLLIVKVGIPDIIGSICTMLLATGIQYLVTEGGTPIHLFGNKYNSFTSIGKGNWLGFPRAGWILLIVTLLGYLLLHRTKFGFRIYAIGGNRHAALVQGIATNRLRFITFVLSSVCASFGGILVAAYSGGGIVQGADQYLFLTIISNYVGTALSPFGLVTILGTAFGATFVATLGNVLAMLQVPYYGEYLFKGILLLIAVVFSKRRIETIDS